MGGVSYKVKGILPPAAAALSYNRTFKLLVMKHLHSIHRSSGGAGHHSPKTKRPTGAKAEHVEKKMTAKSGVVIIETTIVG